MEYDYSNHRISNGVKNFHQPVHRSYMKTTILSILTFVLAICTNSTAFAQTAENNLYFLADTLNVPKGQRILGINERDFNLYENEYVFFCKCIAPHKDNLAFSYINTNKNRKENMLSKKPNYKYISWKDLVLLIEKYQNNFDKVYNLYIVEVLPRNRYKTNLVKLVRYATVQ